MTFSHPPHNADEVEVWANQFFKVSWAVPQEKHCLLTDTELYFTFLNWLWTKPGKKSGIHRRDRADKVKDGVYIYKTEPTEDRSLHWCMQVAAPPPPRHNPLIQPHIHTLVGLSFKEPSLGVITPLYSSISVIMSRSTEQRASESVHQMSPVHHWSRFY